MFQRYKETDLNVKVKELFVSTIRRFRTYNLDKISNSIHQPVVGPHAAEARGVGRLRAVKQHVACGAGLWAATPLRVPQKD